MRGRAYEKTDAELNASYREITAGSLTTQQPCSACDRTAHLDRLS